TIFMDNQAIIHSSSRPSAKPGHYLLLCDKKLIALLQKKKNVNHMEVLLNWIAEHANIHDNKLTNRKAKKAAIDNINSSPKCCLPSILHKLLLISIS
ncbi:hypothetical protein V8B97DRAFT_1855554, partial [Scleroderma yunnanense]